MAKTGARPELLQCKEALKNDSGGRVYSHKKDCNNNSSRKLIFKKLLWTGSKVIKPEAASKMCIHTYVYVLCAYVYVCLVCPYTRRTRKNGPNYHFEKSKNSKNFMT